MTTTWLARRWLLPLLVVLLRGLPFLVAQTGRAPAGSAFVPIGYNPKDLLSYVAFARQVGDGGHWLWANPFTTELQSGRFFFLLHSVLGGFSAATGLDPFWTLELARIPLTFAFFAVLWRFTGAIWSDEATRRTAYWLIGLSGGLELVVDLLSPLVPKPLDAGVVQDLWHLQGWNTFEALYNPLWTAGLALSLLILKPILTGGGPKGARDVIQIGVGFFLLYWVHPYSAIAVLAVACVRPALGVIVQEPFDAKRHFRVACALAPALVLIAAIAAWQSGDAVFRKSSGAALGRQNLSVFWYPVTFGLLGFFAVRGFRSLVAAASPLRYELGAWIAAIVLLHTSPLLNGYHFVFHLHLPVCLVAAPIVLDTFRHLRTARSGRAVKTVLLALGLFVSCAVVTWKSLQDLWKHSMAPRSFVAVAQLLAEKPPGNVLAPPDLGNLIPAYGPQRVYVGQWFLTPDYAQRVQITMAALNDPRHEGDLLRLLEAERIRYLVTPASQAARLATALRAVVQHDQRVEDLHVFELRIPAGG